MFLLIRLLVTVLIVLLITTTNNNNNNNTGVVYGQVGRCSLFDLSGSSGISDEDIDGGDGGDNNNSSSTTTIGGSLLDGPLSGPEEVACPTNNNVIGLPRMQDVICKYEQDALNVIFRSSGQTGPFIYRLCPNTIYNASDNNFWTASLDETVYVCGNDGNVDDECVLEGGEVHIFLWDQPPEIAKKHTLSNVRFEGITFRGASFATVIARGSHQYTVEFVNCRFLETGYAIIQDQGESRRRRKRRRNRRRRMTKIVRRDIGKSLQTPDTNPIVFDDFLPTRGMIQMEIQSVQSSLSVIFQRRGFEDGVRNTRNNSLGSTRGTRRVRPVDYDVVSSTPRGMNIIMRECIIEVC
jgi:hypothetical protein